MDNNDVHHPQQSSDTKPLTYTTKYVCVLLMYQSDPTIQDNWLAARALPSYSALYQHISDAVS